MEVYQCAVTKRLSWRSADENFSNVYTCKHNDPGEANFIELAGALAEGERDIHQNNTTFVSVRVWGPIIVPGDGIDEDPDEVASFTQYLADLSGVGDALSATDMYRELSVMLSAYIGRNPATGRKRFLRKYYHSAFGETLAQSSITQGVAMSSAITGSILTKFNASIVTPLVALGWTHCAMNGDVPAQPWTVNSRPRIRQFRR